MTELFPVIFEDNDLLVINKPAGLVCHPTKGDEYSSLISRVRLHLGAQAEPQLVNRLDRETSGIVLVAKNAMTALELRRLWESREVQKTYFAMVHGMPEAKAGSIETALGKDLHSEVAIKDCVVDAGSIATTRYELLKTFERGGRNFSLLKVMPLTGRKHQIRIHLAHIGHPIVGDKMYGGDERLYLAFVKSELTAADRERLILENHALHAAQVNFFWRGITTQFSAPWDAAFAAFFGENAPVLAAELQEKTGGDTAG